MSGKSEFKISKPFALIAVMFATAATACSDSTGVNTVSSVVVTPSTKRLVVGDEAALAARAFDGSGRVVLGRPAAWSSSNAAIATVTATGLVRAIAPGTLSIQATIDGKVGAAQLTVELASVARVEINPANLSLAEGESRTLVATAFDASGRPLDGRAVVWTSRDPAIADVDASGRILAKRVGTIVVTATVEGRTADVAVTVTRVPVASIAVTPTALILSVGQARQLTAIVLDAAGNQLKDRVVIWTTDTPAVARVSGTGLVWGMGPGYATITATSEGKSFSLAVTGQNGELESMPYDLIYHRWSATALGEIMILGTGEGSQPIKLNAGNVSREPTPSPNGNRIAFAVSQLDLDGSRMDDVFAVDRNGMNMKRLTTEAGADDQPAWSPLGDRIAYRHVDAASGRTDIWLMNADGSQKVNLTSELPDKQSIGEPAWSADGTRIAFALSSSLGVVGPSSGIWTMKTDGSDPTDATSPSGSPSTSWEARASSRCGPTGRTCGCTRSSRSGVARTTRAGSADNDHEADCMLAVSSRRAHRVVGRDISAIGHLPIAFQRGASQLVIFDPRDGSGAPMDRLLEDMNAYLDSLGVSKRIAEGRRVSAVTHAATRVPPEVSGLAGAAAR